MKNILALLMIQGAQTKEKAFKREDLGERCGIEADKLNFEIERLVNEGYLIEFMHNNSKYLYLTSAGLVAASSIYS